MADGKWQIATGNWQLASGNVRGRDRTLTADGAETRRSQKLDCESDSLLLLSLPATCCARIDFSIAKKYIEKVGLATN